MRTFLCRVLLVLSGASCTKTARNQYWTHTCLERIPIDTIVYGIAFQTGAYQPVHVTFSVCVHPDSVRIDTIPARRHEK